MSFPIYKYSALGNEYLVVDPLISNVTLTPDTVHNLCDPASGPGGDGVLLGPASHSEPFALRIFNSDGSEAERSGNGIRIFAKYLFDKKYVTTPSFLVSSPAGVVRVQLNNTDATEITVEMGMPIFMEPVERTINGSAYVLYPLSIGNPHCVIFHDSPTADIAQRLGPLIEQDAAFPNRTNVQFVNVLNEHTIAIEIWERGSGYTLSSGTSSCAAAAVCQKIGKCQSPVEVRMPGGSMIVEIDEGGNVQLTGSVSEGHLIQ